jgi:pimeloyl-ACP methyl ester carboxylesterase
MLTGVVATVLVVVTPGAAQVVPFPTGFRTHQIPTNGTTLFVRTGGVGPAVVLLHGYGETGDMWGALAARLAPRYTVIVPDLRGMGLSARPAGGYDKKTQGHDIAGVLDALKIDKADLVTHDIGNIVGYALAAEYPSRISRFVIIDAPLPGIGPWDDIVRNHALWHFSFWGPDAERLVAGRERIYLDRLWNEMSADPKKFSEAARALRATVRPARCHARRVRAIQGLRPGRGRRQGVLGPWKAPDAGAGGRRSEVVRTPDGRDHAIGRDQRRTGYRAQLRTLDHGGESGGDDHVGD